MREPPLQKLEFYLQVYFAIYPLLYRDGEINSNKTIQETMDREKQSIIEIKPINICIIFVNNSKSTMQSNNIIINYNNMVNNNNEYQVNISYYNKEHEIECSLDDVNYDNTCIYNLKPGIYSVYVRHDKDKVYRSFEIMKQYEGTFSSTIDVLDEYYLALNGTKKLNFTFNYSSDFDKTVSYKIEDPSIISIDGDVITGIKVGSTNLIATLLDGNYKKYRIVVTDIIQPMEYNNNKPYLPCKKYTTEEAHLLDTILDSRVKEAGYGTRGGVIAAARFLTMEFPYMIRYFNENGRLVNHSIKAYIDGEGRYYHKGLYLSTDKYDSIVSSTKTGPNMWGCNIYDSFISKMNQNGFTCSGFVTWAMLNGGFDIGDVGAGNFTQYDDDLSDMGPHHELTDEYMKNGNYKVGDFIARGGHAALIIGIDEHNIYTAESLPPKLMTYTYERYSGIVKDENLTYVIEMGDIYPNGDGWYTDMWK